ncbi:MAG: CYTH domain-containing protein [Bacillaceae bacterium]
MKQEIEIEFKNLLTKAEFQALMKKFNIQPAHFFKQTNYYFDTKKMSLKEANSALRIREKDDTYTLTLKQPCATGLLESHQTLTKTEAQQLLAGQTVITSPMKEVLKELHIESDELIMFGSLTTERTELTYKEGLLVLDHSYYFDCDDYEIEYEVTDEEQGKQHFQALLKELHIPIRKTENKIKRFYIEKKKRERENG